MCEKCARAFVESLGLGAEVVVFAPRNLRGKTAMWLHEVSRKLGLDVTVSIKPPRSFAMGESPTDATVPTHDDHPVTANPFGRHKMPTDLS